MVIDQSVEKRLKNLRIWNIVVGLVLLVQAIMVAILTNDLSLPVTATFMTGPPGSPAKSPTASIIVDLPSYHSSSL
ncbi:MAG: hypothetical protein JW762_09700 [Dehalococcoidales bacterium]|nr:hypothetical protein [Dehalococcoidales bacterium]